MLGINIQSFRQFVSRIILMMMLAKKANKKRCYHERNSFQFHPQKILFFLELFMNNFDLCIFLSWHYILMSLNLALFCKKKANEFSGKGRQKIF